MTEDELTARYVVLRLQGFETADISILYSFGCSYIGDTLLLCGRTVDIAHRGPGGYDVNTPVCEDCVAVARLFGLQPDD